MQTFCSSVCIVNVRYALLQYSYLHSISFNTDRNKSYTTYMLQDKPDAELFLLLIIEASRLVFLAYFDLIPYSHPSMQMYTEY